MEYQEEAGNQIELLQMKDIYNLENPLFIMNPYGTNRLGMYVYLNTDEESFIEYTVTVNDQRIRDFTRHLYNNEDTKAEKEHEGYIIGLVPGVKNTITFRHFDGDNTIKAKYVYTVEVPKSDGLLALFETSKTGEEHAGHILFYDNSGVIRSEIPLDGNSGNSRIEFVDENILYACSDNQFALVDAKGEVKHIYTVDGYTLHHDFDYDDDEDCIIALATNNASKTKEDSIVLINLENDKSAELFSFTEIFPDIAKKAVNSSTDPNGDGEGWIKLNSIQIMDSDNIIVGSKELNSIIKVDKIRENPAIEYIIADPAFWEGTPYSNYLLSQEGTFTNHAGQYNVTYLKDDSLDDGQYYLHMYDNNYGGSEAYPDFDFTEITNVGTTGKDADHSYYYRYLIDEDAKTYELKDSFAVPYSNVLGSTQEVDSNRVVCSGTKAVFGEYDKSGNLIVEYRVDVPAGDQLYRVYKYKMDGYWFS